MRRIATFVPIPARGHMPFPGTRTQKEVREDQARYELEVWDRGGKDIPYRVKALVA